MTGAAAPVPSLRVLEIFDSVQGEGCWTGTPMTFVRLAGCNGPGLGLGCAEWCDTPGGWDGAAGQTLTPEQVRAQVDLPRVCLTGGEPLLQARGVGALVPLLQRDGIKVHVETNGTMPVPAGVEFDWVTVGPKPPAWSVHAGIAGSVEEIKLVVDTQFSVRVAEALAKRLPSARICLQPEFGRAASAEEAFAEVLAHPGWRLSVQMHKYLGWR